MSASPEPVLQPRSVAIMQPTFLPWVGYFALMERVDRFVFLDDVQFDKRSWQQRNRIKTANGPLWLTVPVLAKGRRDQIILDAHVQPDARFADAARKTLEHAYGKAAFFDPVMNRLAPEFDRAEEGLCALNLGLIEALCDLMGLSVETVRSSQTPVTSTKAERLADLCRIHGATDYVSPPGSKDYLDGDDALDRVGVSLKYFAYEHPIWPQLHGGFEPYMSALDLVMNALPDARAIVRSGIGPDILP